MAARIALLEKPAKQVSLAGFSLNGAGNGTRTRDIDLGKVALYH